MVPNKKALFCAMMSQIGSFDEYRYFGYGYTVAEKMETSLKKGYFSEN